jgi:cell division protein FtsZ
MKFTLENPGNIYDMRQIITGICSCAGAKALISLYWDDIYRFFSEAGSFGCACAVGRAEAATKAALKDLKAEGAGTGYGGAIITFTGSPDMSLSDISDACAQMYHAVAEDAEILLGAAIEEELDDEVRVVVVVRI